MRWLSVALILTPALAHADPLTIRTEDCRLLTRHTPSADVEYKPGVDVRGKPVAPADLGGGANVVLPDEITIDIGIDLADRIGRRRGDTARPLRAYEGKAAIGKVTVNGNRVLWNGEPLETQEQAALIAACRAKLADAPPDKPQPPAAKP